MEPSININEIVLNVIGYSSQGLKVNNNPFILHKFEWNFTPILHIKGCILLLYIFQDL